MENINFIVGIGAEGEDLVLSNLMEAENFTKNFDRPAFIFTANENNYNHTFNKSGVKLVSYKLLEKITSPTTTVVNNRGVDFLESLSFSLQNNSNCLFVIDLLLNEFPDDYDFAPIFNEIEKYRHVNNIHVLCNITNYVFFQAYLLELYTCVKAQGLGHPKTYREETFKTLVSLFGDLDGLGLTITGSLLSEYQRQYNDFCKKESKVIDRKVLISPIYYFNSSISLNSVVARSLLLNVLEKMPFIDKTVDEIMEIFKTHD